MEPSRAEGITGGLRLHPGFDPGEDWNDCRRTVTLVSFLLHPGFDPGEDWNCGNPGEGYVLSLLHPGFDPGEDWNIHRRAP